MQTDWDRSNDTSVPADDELWIGLSMALHQPLEIQV